MKSPQTNPLGALFHDSTSRFHDRVAISTPERDITYAELRVTVTGIARNLQAKAVGRGSLVGIYIKSQDIETPFSILALTLLGAPWIPYGEYLNGHPTIKLTHLLHDDPERLPERFSMLVSEIWPEKPVKGKDDEFTGYASADDTWFMPSSSGTTGRRKTMAVSVGAFFERILRLEEYPEDGEGFSVADLFTRDSNLSCLHFFHTLRIGGTYVFGKSYTFMAARKVQLMVGSPRQLADFLADVPPPTKPVLHEVRVVGGALLPAFLERLLRYFAVVRTSYGATETGPVCANQFDRQTSEIPVGTCYPGIALEIVDENYEALGNKREGAVRIKTSSQVTGYVRDANSSEDAFRDGWFYPGDRGRLTAEGELYITGREQDILNISGVKFNAAEIDKTLQSADNVEDALCFIEVYSDGVENLAALVVLPANADKKRAIKGLVHLLLSEKYPPGLLPKRIYQVDEIPRNENGKAMRHRAAHLAAELTPAARVG